MKVLIVGSGGREHTIGWALAKSPRVSEIISAPGNPGLAQLGNTFDISATDIDALLHLAQTEKADLVIVGPEQPLALGLVDRLRSQGIATVGPDTTAAQLETSKAFARHFMSRHGIPIPQYHVVDDAKIARQFAQGLTWRCAIKYDGLAAGKGVFVCQSQDEVTEALDAIFSEDRFGDDTPQVVMEELLVGKELSVLVIISGEHYRILPPSRDHKRAHDGDEGPNTGGMGAYSPVADADDAVMDQIETEIIRPSVQGLLKDGFDYRGVLYVGIMLTEYGAKVLEYNVRMGDPETQVVLPRLQSDFGELMMACAQGKSLPPITVDEQAAIVVVMASKGYPGSVEKGFTINGIKRAEANGVLVFHAGTRLENNELVTAGGRVLGTTVLSNNLATARKKVYQAIESIGFTGGWYRHDIGQNTTE